MNTKIYKYFLFVIVLLFAIGMVSATDNLDQSEDTVTLEKITPNIENTITNTETTGDNTPTKELKTNNEKATPKSDSTPLYVSPDVTEEQEGTSENPTTIFDAISKVTNDGTIILLPGTTGVYTPTEEILIGDETTSDETNKITLTADNPNIIIDASQTTSLFKIKPSYTVTFNNISIHNAKDTAIYNEGNLTINGEATYENNTVPNQQRGFIYAGGNVLINGSNTFTNNNNTHFGSIIYSGWGNVTINGSNTFSNNNVQTGELITGGLISVRGNLTISGTNTFINNSISIITGSWYSLQGGIIYSAGGTCNIIGENIFENNTAGNIGSTTTGGVIYSMSTLNVDGKNVFKNNCLNTSQNGQGAAIYASASNVTIISENLFENNVITGTNSAGGAIYATVTENFNINGSNSFKNNTALKTGGAIHVVINSRANANIIGENLFEQNHLGNTGSNQGAAIYLTPNSHTTINIINASFINNSAIGPGIIYYTLGSYNSNLTTVISGNNFINNTVTGNAILYPNQNDNSELTITNNTFINNIAENEYGDTIMVTSNCQKTIENNTIINSTILLTEIDLTSNIDDTVEAYTPITLNYTPTLTRPKGYDSDIVEKLNYEVYINDENKYNCTGNTFTFTPDEFGLLDIYVMSCGIKSNNIVIDSELNGLKNTLLNVNVNKSYYNDANLIVTVTTTDNNPVNDCGKVYLYENDTILDQKETIDGTCIFSINNIDLGIHNLTIEYNDTTNQYNNQSTNIMLNVKMEEVYVSPDLTEPGIGTLDNPTTIEDAFTKIAENKSIILLDGTHEFQNPININLDKEINITGSDNTIIKNSNITINNPNYNLNISKIYFENTTITTQTQLTIDNCTFNNTNNPLSIKTRVETYSCYIYNSLFENSTSNPAIYHEGTLTIEKSTFNNNTVGTIQSGPATRYNKLYSYNNIYTNNTAIEGGAIFNTYQLTSENDIFINNKATTGGAIYLYSTQANSTISINNSTFIANEATENAGAIYINGRNNTIITNNLFKDIISPEETIKFDRNPKTRTQENNTYTNCTIGMTELTITQDQELTNLNIGDNITINMNNIELTHPTWYDSDILDNMKYELYMNDTLKEETTENTAIITIETPGIIEIYAKTNLADTSSNTITITVIKKDIIIEPITATIGETINITAKITVNDETITDLSKGKVTFKVNGKTLKDTNGKVIYAKVVNGEATIENYEVPSDWAKEGSTIQAIYSGSTQCEKLTSDKTEITIAKAVPTLTTNDITAAAGETITLTATITDNNKVINNGKIVFKINGKTVKDANGKVIYAKVVNNQVSVEYTLPTDMKAKDYNITATFIASDYDKLEASAVMTVVKS